MAHLIDSPNIPCDSCVKVTFVARAPLMPVAQKLRKCEHGVFMSTSICGNFSKKQVCLNNPQSLKEIKHNIEQIVANIDPETLHRLHKIH
jgi:hypothetical protein